MVARDDSVIRGSLIACLIFLGLSLALNFFFWHWGNTQATEAESAKGRMTALQNDLRTREDQARLMKAMLGVGGLTDAEFEMLSQSASGDPEMEAIEEQFVKDMAYFGEAYDQVRNYPELPNYLVNMLRDRNNEVSNAREEVTLVRSQADSDVDNARKAQTQAEQTRDEANKKLEEERVRFTEDRGRMKETTEGIRDELTKNVTEFQRYQAAKNQETAGLTRKSEQLRSTVETQRQELNRLRNDQFESTQGLVTYVLRDGNVVMINLGSADALRPGVTFGVIDGDETRLQDARVKASIQVTRIRGAHLAEARVVARPEVQYPIIPGDKIYSPFWAPGRTVRIAIAGDIDIDNDNRPDTEAIKGMIQAAGAEVAAVVSADGQIEGELDSSVRFLVVGETPTVGDSSASVDDRTTEAIAKIGMIKAEAVEKGITIIPAWKLQAYLRTINDSLTTPLGSAVRGEDFPPEPQVQNNSRVPSDLPELYRRQKEGVQRNNEIVRP